MLSLCPFDISGVGAFVIGLGQISSFLSLYSVIDFLLDKGRVAKHFPKRNVVVIYSIGTVTIMSSLVLGVKARNIYPISVYNINFHSQYVVSCRVDSVREYKWRQPSTIDDYSSFTPTFFTVNHFFMCPFHFIFKDLWSGTRSLNTPSVIGYRKQQST